jgi:hypothetical protein
MRVRDVGGPAPAAKHARGLRVFAVERLDLNGAGANQTR